MGRWTCGLWLLALITLTACGEVQTERANSWRLTTTATQIDELSTLIEVEVSGPDGSPVPNARVTVTAGVGAPLSIDGRTSHASRTNGEGRISAPVGCLGTGEHYVEVETIAPGGVEFEFVAVSCPTRSSLGAEVGDGAVCEIEIESASAVAGLHDSVGELNRVRVWVAPELRHADGVVLRSTVHSVEVLPVDFIRTSAGDPASTIDESGHATFYVSTALEGVFEIEAAVLNVPCDDAELIFLRPTCSFKFPNGIEGPVVDFEVCFEDLGETDLSSSSVRVVANEFPISLVLDESGCARSWFSVRDGEQGSVSGFWAEEEVCRADVAVPNRPVSIELSCPESVTEGCEVTCDVVARGKDGVRVRWPDSVGWEVEGGSLTPTYEFARLSLELSQLVDRDAGESEVWTNVGHPSDALATVMVSIGNSDELLVDGDSDGTLDASDSFVDDPGPFLDANDDGIPQNEEQSTGFRDYNGSRDTGVTASARTQIAVFDGPAEGPAPSYPNGQLTHFSVDSTIVRVGESVVFDSLEAPTNHRTVTVFVFDENGTAPTGAVATWTGCGVDRRRGGLFEPTVRIVTEMTAVGPQTLREQSVTVFEPSGVSTGIHVVESCTLAVEVHHAVCGETWQFAFDFVVAEE